MNYQRCNRCVMDTTVSDIVFDKQGNCNYCSDFLRRINFDKNKNINKNLINSFVDKVKADGEGKEYDCIIGVSGGIDSSWVLVQAVELGLRPLAVHMDNGWNSQFAIENIRNLVEILKVDLHILKIDSNEYNSLLKSFLQADVIDIELLYDNAMLALNYKMAKKYNIKYILSGSNYSTEGIRIPKDWNWLKLDKSNIISINNKFNKTKITTLPTIGVRDYFSFEVISRIKWVNFLDMLEYNKNQALEGLERNYKYQPYPYKHYESILTRFYQGYILPKKFGIDKRLPHFSSLIITEQLSREDAITDLNQIAYESAVKLEQDLDEFVTRLNWSKDDLMLYLSRPRISHDYYGSESWLWGAFKSLSYIIPSGFISYIRGKS